MALTSPSNVVYFVGLLLLFTKLTRAEDEPNWEFSFDESLKEMVVGEAQDFQLNFKILNISQLNGHIQFFYLKSSDYSIAHFFDVINLNGIKENVWNRINFTINPQRPGTAYVYVGEHGYSSIINDDKNFTYSMKVIVHRNLSLLESKNALIYLGTFNTAIFIILNLCFGASLDIRKVNEIFHKPAAMILAVVLNIIILPLVS